jgi:1-acyl-sn-glycerol-3-phosphate acyltransferase
MDFGSHLVKTLSARRHGSVKVVYHQPVKVDDFPNRKALAAHVEGVIRSGMPSERQVAG